MERYRKCPNKKSKSKLIQEINLCRRFWNCYHTQYIQYDLYRKDKQLSEEELKKYIPHYFFYNVFLRYYNPDRYSILLNDKIIKEQLFRSLSISQPYTMSKLINNRFYSNEMKETKFSYLRHELNERKYKKIFVKSRMEHCARGFYIFNRSDTGSYITQNNEMFSEEFLKRIGTSADYIIQPGLEQDDEMSKIYPHSINTFRIVTRNTNGDVRILCFLLRMGRNGKQVDNATQGGIFININTKTGEMGDYARSLENEYFDRHPDTGFYFKNYKITSWDKIKEFALESAMAAVDFPYLGWDIALTKNGILALETDSMFDLDICQLAMGGLRDVFEINDVLFFWKNAR